MSKPLTTSPERETAEMHGLTGIYIRAKGSDGKCGAFDLAELDAESLDAWLLQDGGGNMLAENAVRVLMGHPQKLPTP